MIELYLPLKWLHILSSTVLFGTGMGTAFHMWMTWRGGALAPIAAAARHTVLADWLFTLPAGIVQPLSGIALAHAAGWPLTASWLVASYALYLLAFACWVPVVMIQIRVAAAAKAALETGTPLPAETRRAMQWWFALGWPAFLALTAVFALMVGKPALW